MVDNKHQTLLAAQNGQLPLSKIDEGNGSFKS
ncbi:MULTISPECIES: phage protease [Nitrosomonas]|nr:MULTISPECIES: phage protease [Nitrosomonas]UVS60289.1 phage protease [Nitrosomonas sp. PLL12]